MGEVFDPWKQESLVMLPEHLLDSGWEKIVPVLSNLSASGFRLPLDQAEVIYRRYVMERGKPYPYWLELQSIFSALALARHPKMLEEIEEVFSMGKFDFTGVASEALLAWHGLPELLLLWVDELDSLHFEMMPRCAQDFMRGVDLYGSWNRIGISCYFEGSSPDKLRQMSEAFVRMDMLWAADAMNDAAEWWNKVEAVQELRLCEDEHFALFTPVYSKWETAAWKINDDKNPLLEGLCRFAAKHSPEFRRVLGWLEDPPT
jgi:hypothetical protein